MTTAYVIKARGLLRLVIASSFIFFACQSKALEHTFGSSPFSQSYDQFLVNKAESEKKRFYLLWDLESSAESYSSAIDNAFFFQFRSAGKFRYQFLDRLHLDLKAVVQFQGGQAQSRFAELLPSGPAFLSHGFFNFDVLEDEMFQIKAGALPQFDAFGNNLFISRRAFPGIGSVFKLENENYKMEFSAQQVVPTTFTFSNALIEREATPSLGSANGLFAYKNEIFSAGIRAGFFNYDSLPAYVADTSRLFGNSVIGTGNAAAEFRYDFRGWMTNSFLTYSPTKDTSFKFVLDMLENVAAPKTYNQSQLIQISGHHRLNRDLGIDVVLSDFFVESDAVPAFFTSRTTGQTNTRGVGIEMGFQWIEKKVRVSAGYIVSNLINPDESERQLESDVITINLESAYDLFN